MADIQSNRAAKDDGLLSRLAEFFADLSAYRSLFVAVSGGADSVALLLLLARWAKEQADAPEIYVATIDHALRDGSSSEVVWVHDLATRLGFRHHTRRWDDEKPSTGVQAAARNARYRLLLDIVLDTKPPAPVALVTAHTQDDQAETVLMRLARGSGIDGLGAMVVKRALNSSDPCQSVDLVRPLLHVTKADLVAFLNSVGQDWCEDPSNISEDFERVRVRRAMPELAAIGLTSSALVTSATRARRVRQALDATVNTFVAREVCLHDGAYANVRLATFCTQPDEIQIRCLKILLDRFGGLAPRPRLAQLEALHLQLGAEQKLRLTVGGCVIDRQHEQLTIYRETGRQPLPVLKLQPGEEATWDRRFKVSCGVEVRDQDQADPPVEVRPLPSALYGMLRSALNPELQRLPVQIAQTLPSFWYQNSLLAVPSLKVDQQFLVNSGVDLLSFSDVQNLEDDGHRPCNEVCQARFVGLPEYHSGT